MTFFMRMNWRFLFAAAAAIAVAAHPRLASASVASVPADTVRAGQCSPSSMAAPDTNAKWYRTMAAWYHETPGAWSNDSLRTELIALEKKDQAVRQGITPDSVRDSAFIKRERVTDSANTARMRAILARYGWPGKSMVGAQGANAAFILIQHSTELGPKGLALMQAAKPGEVSPTDLALIIDRQRTSTGRAQIYGTQLEPLTNGVLPFFPIENPAHAEERRARAGLPPLRDYACMIATMYHAPVVLPEYVTR